MKKISFVIVLIGFMTSCKQQTDFKPRDINFDRDVCHICLMGLTDQRYNAQSINEYGEVHWYDDIGCLVEEMRDSSTWNQWKGDKVKFWIGDAGKGNDPSNWIDAESAYYDFGKHTPMGYGYSAYAEKPDADSIFTFNEVIQRINEGKTMREGFIQEKMLMMKDNPEKLKKLEEKLEKERNKKE
ncbi:MAG: nitrous oxide reductase accessory protein NosL [Bacteroidota bacterium]